VDARANCARKRLGGRVDVDAMCADERRDDRHLHAGGDRTNALEIARGSARSRVEETTT